MELTGLHHVSAITGNAARNLEFYTQTLGLRLVKKTVNQDDVSSYHLFYGDKSGSPGTEVTFFDWPGAGPNRPGVGAISSIALSVGGLESLDWWSDRLRAAHIEVSEIRKAGETTVLDFVDFEGQRLSLVDQPSAGSPWEASPVPKEKAVRGLHHVTLTVRHLDATSRVLTDVLSMRQSDEYLIGHRPVHVFEMGTGGAGKELHVVQSDQNFLVRLGAGGVHHVAFRTANAEEQSEWLNIVRAAGLHVSPIIDRYYFQSIYFREPGGILFEIATDGPGFASDESADHLGETLALPPFLESKRAEIEAGLVPL